MTSPPNAGTDDVQNASAPDVAYDPILRVRAPSLEHFEEEYLRPARPVVITGVVETWPAWRRWSLDYFSNALGDTSAITIATREGRIDIPEELGARFDRVRLGEFVSKMRSGESLNSYVAAPIRDFPARFFDDFIQPPYCSESKWYLSKFWLGPRGTVTPLHWDLPHNLSAQVIGRKRWILYPPTQLPLLYPCQPWSRSPNVARVDPEGTDLARFPRFARARPVGTVLEPGEMLYIPRLWWHHVRSLAENSALSFWFGGAPYAIAGTIINAFKRVRGLYPGEG
jgi:hypothetical protein